MGKAIYTVFDIETTGLSAACQCEIIEFAGIQYDEDFNEVDRLHIYVKPYKKLPKKIIELTGITNEQLAGCENRFKVLPKIRSFIGNTWSVCHNAQFDFGFISTMCLLQGLPILNKYICTLKSYKAITGEKSGKLFQACENFGIELKNAHTAIADVEATAKLFKKLIEIDKDNEQSKIYTKIYNEKDLYVELMSNIAVQNPNKKVRDAVCEMSISGMPVKTNIDIVFSEFNNGKDPNYITTKYGYDNYEVSLLFALWLNKTRLPKFIYIEDFTLNRQVGTMINHAYDLSDMYELHKKIYNNASTNYGLYNYFWIKQNKMDDVIISNALNTLFLFEYNLTELVKLLPHIDTKIIVKSYCAFAFSNKEKHRQYIKSNCCSRSELDEAVSTNREFTNSELLTNPELIKIAITRELYLQGFFKI
jgi:DNA polymerase III epsilon subunit family exonuclease